MPHTGSPGAGPPGVGAAPPPSPAAASQGGGQTLSREKACQILEDGQVSGQPLTPPQQRLMGAVCSGQQLQQAEHGALIMDDRAASLNTILLEVDLEDPGFLAGLG